MIADYPKTLVSSHAIEQSTFNYLDFISALPKFARYSGPDVTCISADAPVLYFSSAFKANFNGNAERRIKETKEFFFERDGAFVWQVTPSSQPANLGEQLIHQGGQFLRSVPYMVLQLDEVHRDFPIPANFHCEAVRTHEMLAMWTSIYCHARAYPESADRLFNILSDLDLTEASPLQLILGYLNDTPVATYSIFRDREIAGFYSLSTLPEARGQGLGTAISIANVDRAKEYGYEIAALNSDPMSRNICKRLGFVEGFGNMDIYRMSA